jgi:ABC-type antimicrobial peptide transport system permease subunit
MRDDIGFDRVKDSTCLEESSVWDKLAGKVATISYSSPEIPKMHGFQAMMYLGLMFTIVVMFNTMVMNVAERDFELATLRVLGASTKSLGLMLLFESLLIGLLGGLVGVLFAYGGAVGLAASISSWQFYIPVVIVPSVAYQLMGGVLAIAVAMTPFGVWRLRRMDLIEKIKNLSN